jgi:hypothetical protein
MKNEYKFEKNMHCAYFAHTFVRPNVSPSGLHNKIAKCEKKFKKGRIFGNGSLDSLHLCAARFVLPITCVQK